MGKAICLALCGIMLLGAFPISYDTSGYAIDRFSDGSLQKDLLFTSLSHESTVFVSVPRATNLSWAELQLAANTSVLSVMSMEDAFTTGTGDNVTTGTE